MTDSIVGITMGTHRAWPLADFFLYFYIAGFILNKNRNMKVIYLLMFYIATHQQI